MELILDETSLAPFPERTPAERITTLARSLRTFDDLGVVRVLRCVRDAADRDIEAGSGLRRWCFDPSTNREAGRLVATRLSKQPFIDGADGLFSLVEGVRAIEATVNGTVSLGAGLAALTHDSLVALASSAIPAGKPIVVDLAVIDGDGERTNRVDTFVFINASEVQQHRAELLVRIDQRVADGQQLLERIPEIFPRLLLGPLASKQVHRLNGNEPVFRQLIRHLRLLNGAALKWQTESSFQLEGLTHSVESQATLHDGHYGPMREFPVPNGFKNRRWTHHTKLTGAAGARLYFEPERVGADGFVLIGYFGDHLPTIKYPT